MLGVTGILMPITTRIFSIGILIVLLTSCVIPFGDGGFYVYGQLLSSAPIRPDCLIELFGEEQQSKPLQSNKVWGSYEVLFTVAPLPRQYTVRVLCGGHILHTSIAKYGTEVSPIKPLNMPVIRILEGGAN
jgi:hypothetical protein